MTMLTRLRRALCRHDWLPLYARADLPTHRRCRKCGVMRRVEP